MLTHLSTIQKKKNNPFNVILSYSEAFQYADVLRSLRQC